MTPMGTEELAIGELNTPIGTLVLVASEVGLRQVRLPDNEGRCSPVPVGSGTGRCDEVLAFARTQLTEYFGGRRRQFDLPLDLVGTEFQRSCWRALAEVDYATTITYGEQAARIARPRAVRAVGGANRLNPLPIVLPCHRVIGADGSLTGFAGGLEMKRWLIEHERETASGIVARP